MQYNKSGPNLIAISPPPPASHPLFICLFEVSRLSKDNDFYRQTNGAVYCVLRRVWILLFWSRLVKLFWDANNVEVEDDPNFAQYRM